MTHALKVRHNLDQVPRAIELVAHTIGFMLGIRHDLIQRAAFKVGQLIAILLPLHIGGLADQDLRIVLRVDTLDAA